MQHDAVRRAEINDYSAQKLKELRHSESLLEDLGSEALHHFARGLGLDLNLLAKRHALARGRRLLVAKLDHGHARDRELAVFLQSVGNESLQGCDPPCNPSSSHRRFSRSARTC